MKKWIYRFDTAKITIGDEEWIDEVGKEGWELVAIKDVGDLYLFIFKKQV